MLIAVRALVNQGVTLHGLSAYTDNSNMKLMSILQKRFNNYSVLEQHSLLFRFILESVRKTLKNQLDNHWSFYYSKNCCEGKFDNDSKMNALD